MNRLTTKPNSRWRAAMAGLGVLALIAIDPGAATGQDEVEMVEAEILTLADSGVILDLPYVTREGVSEMSIYSRGFAPAIDYAGPRRMVFFRQLPSEEGFDTVRTTVGTVDLPAGAKRVLLLFEKEDGDEEAYRILAVNNDFDRFPPGAYRFVNTTDQSLVGWLGDQRFVLEPEASVIASARGDDNGNVVLSFYRSGDDGAGPERIYQSVWQVKDSRRTSVFVTESATRVREIGIRKMVEPIVPEREADNSAEGG